MILASRVNSLNCHQLSIDPMINLARNNCRNIVHCELRHYSPSNIHWHPHPHPQFCLSQSVVRSGKVKGAYQTTKNVATLVTDMCVYVTYTNGTLPGC